MKNLLLLLSLSIYSVSVFAQIPKSGTYDYKINFAENSYSHVNESDCKVIIDGEKIKILYTGKNISRLKKGDVIDEGTIMKHKSGSWIIGHKESDKELDEIGGCTEGPNEIDFDNAIFWMC